MTNNPNAEQNLTPFQPGQSGNLSGRPKGPITSFLRLYGEVDALEVTVTRTKGERSDSETVTLATDGSICINQAIAAKLLVMAASGDLKAIREVLNRTEGRVPQPINLGGQANNPVRVVTYMPDNGRRKRPDAETGGNVSGIPDQAPPTE